MGIGLLAFVADSLLNHFAFGDGWTILWPLNGFTVAALLMLPRSKWPLVILPVALGTYFGEVLDGNGWIDEACIRLISVTEVLLTALCLPAFVNLENWLFQPHIFRRLITALVVGPGGCGLIAAVYYHQFHGTTYIEGFRAWGPADALGLATVMPLVFSIHSSGIRRLFNRKRLGRTTRILGLAFAGSTLIFYQSRYPLIFVLYPILLLVDLKLGFAGSTIAVAWVCLISVWLTTSGYGPFAATNEMPLPSDLSLQIYLGFHILILFPASILFLERRRVYRQLRDAYSQMSQLAAIDQLTGIPNRRSLDAAIVQTWDWHLGDGGQLAVLMVDVDHFKEFNDSLGHQAGDVCLAAVATAIAAPLVGTDAIVARYGGEEFAVLLPTTSPSHVDAVAKSLLQAVRSLKYPHPLRDTVTVSIGCASLKPSIETSSAELINLADQALYLAKKAGRNCVCWMPAGQSIAVKPLVSVA
jgi:diguanylate cyclase (GGDEF)-like protein